MTKVSNASFPVNNAKESSPAVLANNSWTLAKKVGLALMITSVALTALSILAALFIQKGILQLPPQLQTVLFSTNPHSLTIGSFTTSFEALSLTGVDASFAGTGLAAALSAISGKALMEKKPAPISKTIAAPIPKNSNSPDTPNKASPEPKLKGGSVNSVCGLSGNPLEQTPENPLSPGRDETSPQVSPPTPIRGAGSSTRTPTPQKRAADPSQSPQGKNPQVANGEQNKPNPMPTPVLKDIRGFSMDNLKKPSSSSKPAETEQSSVDPQKALNTGLTSGFLNVSGKLSSNQTAQQPANNHDDDGNNAVSDEEWDAPAQNLTSTALASGNPTGYQGGFSTSSTNLLGSQSTAPAQSNPKPVTLEKAMENCIKYAESKVKTERCLTTLKYRIEAHNSPQERLILICTSNQNRIMVIGRLKSHLNITSQLESSDENNEILLKLSHKETEEFKQHFRF